VDSGRGAETPNGVPSGAAAVPGPQRTHTLLGWLLHPRALIGRIRWLVATVREVDERSRATAGELATVREVLAAEVADVERGARERDHALALRSDALERELRILQEDVERLRRDWAASLEARVDRVAATQGELIAELERLRDHRLPALAGKLDVLVERLAAEIDELASLLERSLRNEPLPVPMGSQGEDDLAAALADIQPRLVATLRGGEDEIRHRLEHHLAELAAHPPVLDLGCGRGELLDLLREAGVPAQGVEADPALAGAARRRGLAVREGDLLAVLRDQSAGSCGAVSAIHVFEHLPAPMLLASLAEVRRVLAPGGVLVVESPNPHSLRVGASLYWLDPTHQRPLMPETLELFLIASGLEVVRREWLHPFPAEQRLLPADRLPRTGASADVAALAADLDRALARLDELLNGPRDFVIVARSPSGTVSSAGLDAAP
jgi:SAM-dependent methyltransferase